MLYSCTHMATVGFKGLNTCRALPYYWLASVVSCCVCARFSHVVMNFFFEFLFVLFDSEVLKFGWTVSDRTKTIQATVCNHHPRTEIWMRSALLIYWNARTNYLFHCFFPCTFSTFFLHSTPWQTYTHNNSLLRRICMSHLPCVYFNPLTHTVAICVQL